MILKTLLNNFNSPLIIINIIFRSPQKFVIFFHTKCRREILRRQLFYFQFLIIAVFLGVRLNFRRNVHFFDSMTTSTTRTSCVIMGGYSGVRPSSPSFNFSYWQPVVFSSIFYKLLQSCRKIRPYRLPLSTNTIFTITPLLGDSGTDVDGAAIDALFDASEQHAVTQVKITVFDNEVTVTAYATSVMAFYTVHLDRNPSADHNRSVSVI